MPISEAIEMKLAEVLGDEKYMQFCNQRNEVLTATQQAGLHSAHWAMKSIEMAIQEVVKQLVKVEDQRDEALDTLEDYSAVGEAIRQVGCERGLKRLEQRARAGKNNDGLVGGLKRIDGDGD